MVRFIEANYGKISQISRRKNGSFISEYPARTLRNCQRRAISRGATPGFLKQNLMGSANCEATFGLVPGRPRHVYLQGGLSSPPRAGAVSFPGGMVVGDGVPRSAAQPFGPEALSSQYRVCSSVQPGTAKPLGTGGRGSGRMWPSGGLERCTGAALAEAHKLIKRPTVKTDRILFAPFGLHRSGKGHPRTRLDIGCGPGRVLQSAMSLRETDGRHWLLRACRQRPCDLSPTRSLFTSLIGLERIKAEACLPQRRFYGLAFDTCCWCV
jgi:hypothetical protein